jgi:hypothetical protein
MTNSTIELAPPYFSWGVHAIFIATAVIVVAMLYMRLRYHRNAMTCDSNEAENGVKNAVSNTASTKSMTRSISGVTYPTSQSLKYSDSVNFFKTEDVLNADVLANLSPISELESRYEESIASSYFSTYGEIHESAMASIHTTIHEQPLEAIRESLSSMAGNIDVFETCYMDMCDV